MTWGAERKRRQQRARGPAEAGQSLPSMVKTPILVLVSGLVGALLGSRGLLGVLEFGARQPLERAEAIASLLQKDIENHGHQPGTFADCATARALESKYRKSVDDLYLEGRGELSPVDWERVQHLRANLETFAGQDGFLRASSAGERAAAGVEEGRPQTRSSVGGTASAEAPSTEELRVPLGAGRSIPELPEDDAAAGGGPVTPGEPPAGEPQIAPQWTAEQYPPEGAAEPERGTQESAWLDRDSCSIRVRSCKRAGESGAELRLRHEQAVQAVGGHFAPADTVPMSRP